MTQSDNSSARYVAAAVLVLGVAASCGGGGAFTAGTSVGPGGQGGEAVTSGGSSELGDGGASTSTSGATSSGESGEQNGGAGNGGSANAGANSGGLAGSSTSGGTGGHGGSGGSGGTGGHGGAGGTGGGPACPVVTTFKTVTNADSVILQGYPDLNECCGDVVNVGVGVKSEGVFRFPVAALPAAAKVQAARVHFSYAAHASACGSACASCGSIEAAGTLSLFFMRSDWEEKTVTWNTPWSAPGASVAGVDRSATPLQTLAHVAAQDVTFTMDAAKLGELSTWRSANQLSFEVVPSNGAVFVTATKEWAADACASAGTAPSAATLEVDYCP